MKIGKRNIDDPPHVKEIRRCEDTVEVNRLALYRLLLMAGRVQMQNGSDSVAMSIAFDALEEGASSTSDVSIEK